MNPSFGERLQAARKRAGFRTQQELGDVVGVSGRTIRNYEIGKTTPDLATIQELRRVLGEFDAGGDEVEAAVRRSDLEDWRQTDLISRYQRHQSEQRRERGA